MNHWQPATIPATTPDPRGELIEFSLTDAEREAAARQQAHLETHRNDPQKRRHL